MRAGSNIRLTYWFHCAPGPQLLVRPFLDDEQPGGVFAPCAVPAHPMGISAVRLLGIEGNILGVSEVDIVDGTPLADIKPYAPQFDCYQVQRTGWLGEAHGTPTLADERFVRRGSR